MVRPVECDILICGGGLAGLSLVYRAMRSGIWADQEIRVIDRSEKAENDRTWSFWQTANSAFEEIIHHRWTELVFFSHEGKRIPLDSGPYTYNSIRGIDFYSHVSTYLDQFPNITFVQEDITSMSSINGKCTVITVANTYTSSYIFNSIYQKPELQQGGQYFLQHFKGLRIKIKSGSTFSEAYLMDFRTAQEQGTTFFYTLPLSDEELFIEYTLFSKSLLDAEEYDRQLMIYIRDVLKIEQYDILEQEFGVIPMTDHQFTRFDDHIIHIGTAGGDTRGSTGYTFTNTQKTIDKILHSIQIEGHPFFKTEAIGLKAQLYDATLLNVLSKQEYPGHLLFSDLFSGTPAHLIFAFLDAETSVLEDIKIMTSLKVLPFLKSFLAITGKRIFQSKA